MVALALPRKNCQARFARCYLDRSVLAAIVELPARSCRRSGRSAMRSRREPQGQSPAHCLKEMMSARSVGPQPADPVAARARQLLEGSFRRDDLRCVRITPAGARARGTEGTGPFGQRDHGLERPGPLLLGGTRFARAARGPQRKEQEAERRQRPGSAEERGSEEPIYVHAGSSEQHARPAGKEQNPAANLPWRSRDQQAARSGAPGYQIRYQVP